MSGPGGGGGLHSGTHGIATIGETVLGRLPCPEHCTGRRPKHTPSLPVKKVDLLVLELQPKGQASR